MNVCILEHPRIPSHEHFNDIANTPLWSCLMGGYAAAALAADGNAVTYLDAAADRLDFQSTHGRLLALGPELLAINAVYCWEHTGRLLAFITGLKDALPAMHITLFGFFPSLAPGLLLKHCPVVDSVCVGENENTLQELAAAIRGNRDWRKVSGLAFFRNGRIHFSKTRLPAADCDRFAFPLRLETRAVGEGDTAAILASRGCYNHCAFCPIPVFYNRGALWRGRAVGNVIDEMQTLMEKGYRRFYFVDPNFIGPGKAGRRRALDLMAGLKPLGIRFGMETRPNDLDEELLQAMSAAGLESLLLGIESASPGVLGTLSKHASADENRRAINLCRQAGVEPEVGFLMHTPDATLDDLAGNLDFLETVRLLDRLDRTANLLCHQQIVFRGTRGFNRYQGEGRILGTDALGFEACIAWHEPRARWVADVMVPVCLDVLRMTGDATSPLYWETAETNQTFCRQVNDRLVETFRETLSRAAVPSVLPTVEKARQNARDSVLAGI
jgi:anaerobic magnesium-protoporphyrin IX monomethyl ester cyclase